MHSTKWELQAPGCVSCAEWERSGMIFAQSERRLLFFFFFFLKVRASVFSLAARDTASSHGPLFRTNEKRQIFSSFLPIFT